MTLFGPVGEAAHSGRSNPAFDLIVGFVVLGLTWVDFCRKPERRPKAIWAAIGITAICCVFIYSGVRLLLQ